MGFAKGENVDYSQIVNNFICHGPSFWLPYAYILKLAPLSEEDGVENTTL